MANERLSQLEQEIHSAAKKQLQADITQAFRPIYNLTSYIGFPVTGLRNERNEVLTYADVYAKLQDSLTADMLPRRAEDAVSDFLKKATEPEPIEPEPLTIQADRFQIMTERRWRSIEYAEFVAIPLKDLQEFIDTVTEERKSCNSTLYIALGYLESLARLMQTSTVRIPVVKDAQHSNSGSESEPTEF